MRFVKKEREIVIVVAPHTTNTQDLTILHLPGFDRNILFLFSKKLYSLIV